MKRKHILPIVGLVLVVGLTSCQLPNIAAPQAELAPVVGAGLFALPPGVKIEAAAPNSLEKRSQTSPNAPVALPTPTAAPAAAAGSVSSGARNPLTGLPVANPANLNLPPALVSVTNWPVAARPQAGLSFSPMIFELYIGEGMSRFLAMFYGDYPSAAVGQNGAELLQSADAEIGPIRSGRLPYESVRSLYNGFLVMASAYKGVAANLSQHSSVFGSDEDINSAMIPVTKLEDIARANQRKLDAAALSGMEFAEKAPQGGSPADQFWFIYNVIDQVLWKYDAASGSYLRYQDQADGKNFVRATDRLNGADLTLENVVVLFANHRACTEVAFDIDMMYIKRSPALLFRDGQVYKIFWTTQNEEYEKTTGKLRPIRFVDENGKPFPLKPGQTWVHLAPTGTPYWEAPDFEEVSPQGTTWVSQNPQALLYNLLNKKEPGSGNWVMRYYASMMPYDAQVCQQLRK